MIGSSTHKDLGVQNAKGRNGENSMKKAASEGGGCRPRWHLKELHLGDLRALFDLEGESDQNFNIRRT